MPLPTPTKGEDRSKFVSRCISYESHASPDRDHVQVVAMCHTQWRRETGSKLSEGNMPDVKAAFFSKPGEFKLDSEDGDVQIWRKQILAFGLWKHPENKDIEFEITPEVAEQIAKNFKGGTPQEAPVVLTHTDNPLAKVGKVKSFEVDKDGLYAILSVDNAEVNGNIGSEEKSPGVSVWLDMNYSDKESGDEVGAVVKHVALVNHPYIEGMKGFEAVLSEAEDGKDFVPLILSEKTNTGGNNMPDKITREIAIKFLKDLKDNEVDVEALLTDQKELKDLQDKLEKGELIKSEKKGDKDTAILSDELIKKIKDALKLDESITNADAVIKQLLEKYTELSENMGKKVETLEEKLSDMEADKRVGALLSEGRLLPKEAKPWKDMYKSNPELFTQMETVRKEAKPLIELSEKGILKQEETKAKEKEEQETLDRNIKEGQREGIIAAPKSEKD